MDGDAFLQFEASQGSLGRYLPKTMSPALVVLEDLAVFEREVELPDIEEGMIC